MTATIAPIITKAGYRATRSDDGTMTVHRVPIFVECERGDVNFNREWIEAAVAKAKLAEVEGYLPPLHIRHHEPSTDATNSVRAAGFFRVLGMEQVVFKGATRLAIVADLIITDPATQAEILAKRLPYRSVEIFNVEKPAIDSLALLDHEAPFLELPMLLVSRVEGGGGDCVPRGTFQAPWSMQTGDEGSTVACLFRQGRNAHLLFREDIMAEDKKPEDKKDEKMEAGGMDVGAIVKAIKSGAISVADMDAIVAAIQEQEAGKGAEPEEPEEKEGPAPVDVPGTSMKAGPEVAAKMAALQGELEGTKARLSAIETEAKCKSAVSAAMKRLEGKPLGADLEGTLFKAFREHGESAFSFFVDSLDKSIGVLPGGDDARGAAFASQTEKLSPVVMKFQAEGIDAIDRAAKFSREWAELHSRGMTRMSEERYVATNMAKKAK